MAACHNPGMANALSQIGRKALAAVVLLAALWVILKIVIGIVAGIAWIVVIVGAIIAVIWAYGVLRS